jgi:hypothetical protein
MDRKLFIIPTKHYKKEVIMIRKRIKIIIGLLILPFFIGIAMAGKVDSKIAVAAKGKDPASRISMRGARAPYFLIFDRSGHLFEKVDNPYADPAGDAGSNAADFFG